VAHTTQGWGMAKADCSDRPPLQNAGPANRRLRIAPACPGIGLAQRGFERFLFEIFPHVRGDVDVSLFKDGGDSGEKMLPFIRRDGALDVVHTIDPRVTRVLFHLRAALRMKFRLRDSEGCAMPPDDYPPADFCQQVAKATPTLPAMRAIIWARACASPMLHRTRSASCIAWPT